MAQWFSVFFCQSELTDQTMPIIQCFRCYRSLKVVYFLSPCLTGSLCFPRVFVVYVCPSVCSSLLHNTSPVLSSLLVLKDFHARWGRGCILQHLSSARAHICRQHSQAKPLHKLTYRIWRGLRAQPKDISMHCGASPH